MVIFFTFPTDYVFDGTNGPYYEDDIKQSFFVNLSQACELIVEDLFDKHTI